MRPCGWFCAKDLFPDWMPSHYLRQFRLQIVDRPHALDKINAEKGNLMARVPTVCDWPWMDEGDHYQLNHTLNKIKIVAWRSWQIAGFLLCNNVIFTLLCHNLENWQYSICGPHRHQNITKLLLSCRGLHVRIRWELTSEMSWEWCHPLKYLLPKPLPELLPEPLPKPCPKPFLNPCVNPL